MNPKLFAAIATGSVLLMVGCSSPSSLQGEAPTAQRETPAQTSSKAAGKSEIVNIISAQLSSEKITLDRDKVDAGPVSFEIRNGSSEPLDVILLKTDLPASQIPLKEGKVDTTNGDVKQVGQLVTSPMPANGDETIVRTLEPGNYLMMVYHPGKIDMAMTRQIIVQPTRM